MINKNVTIITGAKSGLGLELAKLYRNNKTNLILIDKDYKKNYTYTSKNFRIFELKKDITNNDLLNKLKKFLNKNNLHLKLLINCAGIGYMGKFSSLDLKKHQKIIDVNIKSLTNLSYFAIKEFFKNKNDYGTLVNIGSSASYFPLPLFSTYSASKIYLDYLTYSLQQENKDSKVNVLLVSPSGFNSSFQESAGIKKKLNQLKTEFVAKEIFEYIESRKNKKFDGNIKIGLNSKIMFILSKIIPNKIYYYILKKLSKIFFKI
jgi:short-subunit dehydrogenase